MQLSRREFLQGATGVAAAVSSGCETVGVKRRDPNFSVLLSDLHIVPDNPVYRSAFEYTRRQLRERIDEILAMHPRPARVVTFGDMAFGHGEISSYEYAAGRDLYGGFPAGDGWGWIPRRCVPNARSGGRDDSACLRVRGWVRGQPIARNRASWRLCVLRNCFDFFFQEAKHMTEEEALMNLSI